MTTPHSFIHTEKGGKNHELFLESRRIAFWLAGVVVFYFGIKAAVKNGINESNLFKHYNKQDEEGSD